MKFQGYIPPRVIYVLREPRRLTMSWDDLEPSNVVGQEVIPAFAVDAASPKSLETARSWAGSGRGKPKQEERANEAIELSVCDLETRERGGRAYKVVTDEGFYFDLREDVLLDTILECGIAKGGRLGGKFVWAVIGSQMKLIRIDSALHRAVVEAGKRKEKSKVRAKDFVPGGIYQTRKGERVLFIGWVSSVECRYVSGERGRFDFTTGGNTGATPDRVEVSNIAKEMVYLDIPEHTFDTKYDKKGMRTPLQWLGETCRTNLYYIKHQKSLTVVEQIDTVELPADVLDLIRKAAIREIKKDAEMRSAQLRGGSTSIACYGSFLANILPYPEQPAVSTEFQSYFDSMQGMIKAAK